MIINLKPEELSKKALLIATPAYGGMIASPYHLSILNTVEMARRFGVNVRNCLIENESLITRARNNIVAMFMSEVNKEYEYLLFIDADINFKPEYVMTLLSLADEYGVICGSYPKKSINWPMIENAVKMGVKSPELKNYIDNPVLNFIPTKTGLRTINIEQPVEVLDTGTGFMMITKDVIRKMIANYPDLAYTPDYKLGIDSFDNRPDPKVFALFDTAICDDETSIEKKASGRKRYLSEDYYFCKLWRDLGGKIWVCPWMNLVHHGTYHYAGNLPKVFALQQEVNKEINKVQTLPRTKDLNRMNISVPKQDGLKLPPPIVDMKKKKDGDE